MVTTIACFVLVGSSEMGTVCGGVRAARVAEMRQSERVDAARRVPRCIQRAPASVDVGWEQDSWLKIKGHI